MYISYIFLAICVVEIQNRVLKPYQSPDQTLYEPGCYENVNKRFLSFNESFSPEDGKTCEKYTCDFDGYIYITGCTETFEGDCLKIPGNKSLAYPNCCDVLDCSKRRNIPNNENTVPKSSEDISQSPEVTQAQESQNLSSTATSAQASSFNENHVNEKQDSNILENEKTLALKPSEDVIQNPSIIQTQESQNIPDTETSPLNINADIHNNQTTNENSSLQSLASDEINQNENITSKKQPISPNENPDISYKETTTENNSINNLPSENVSLTSPTPVNNIDVDNQNEKNDTKEAPSNENIAPTEQKSKNNVDYQRQTTLKDTEIKITDIIQEQDDIIDEKEDITEEKEDIIQKNEDVIQDKENIINEGFQTTTENGGNSQAKGSEERNAATESTN